MHLEQPEVQQAMAQGKLVANVDWFYACCEQKQCLPILEVRRVLRWCQLVLWHA